MASIDDTSSTKTLRTKSLYARQYHGWEMNMSSNSGRASDKYCGLFVVARVARRGKTIEHACSGFEIEEEEN